MESGTVRKRNPYMREGYRSTEYNYDEARRRTEARRRRAVRRRKKIRRQRIAVLCLVFCAAVLVIKLMSAGIGAVISRAERFEYNENTDEEMQTKRNELVQGIPLSAYNSHPAWTEDFLTPNEYSRPQDALTEINSIFVHYTANPDTSAKQNRSYFESLKDNHERSASAHFIIDTDGEIIQCIPLDEIAYAVKTRNYDSVSIECCYTASDGSFTQETYDSLVKLLSWLTDTYNLDTDDILRHYDCGGKKCPIYYVNNPDAWEKLKKDVAEL